MFQPRTVMDLRSYIVSLTPSRDWVPHIPYSQPDGQLLYLSDVASEIKHGMTPPTAQVCGSPDNGIEKGPGTSGTEEAFENVGI